MNLDDLQFTTLASIVEKETGAAGSGLALHVFSIIG